MNPIMRCNTCLQCGDGYWAGEHTVNNPGHVWFTMGGEDEPPSKSRKNSFKLCFSGSRDLYGTIFGCQPLLASNNSFRSLVALGSFR